MPLLALLAAFLLVPPGRFPLRLLAPGVYAVLGDTGRGSEGRPNAGFIVTGDGVVVVDALGSPAQGEALVRTIRAVTREPIRWLVLTHHHPDHHFGAIVLRRAGAKVLAYPDVSTGVDEQSREAGESAWALVVGRDEMRGFTYADIPDQAITTVDTLRLGVQVIVILHPSLRPAHTKGDLLVWIPAARVLFAGDLLIEDGVPLVVDGTSRGLLDALDAMAALHPLVAVPGHGAIPHDPGALMERTRDYVIQLRAAMRRAVLRGTSLNHALDSLPPPDDGRPVSLHSRLRRNANRVYLEIERDVMGLEREATPSPTLVSTTALADLLARHDSGVSVIDVRNDYTLYLQSHLPGAVYLNIEALRAWDRGTPNLVLPLDSYRVLFSRLGVRLDRPVVIYSAGETRDIDATYVAWILQGLGHPAVQLLDGGFGKWDVENRPTTRAYPSVPATAFAPAGFTPDRATVDDARAALGRSDVVLVDARNPEQYAGLAGAQLRRGHIPGAINHFWQQDLVKVDFATVWRSSDDLRLAYGAQGITPEKQIIAYCNGGLESSHVYFALHNVLGYPRVRVYDGSFTEWSERIELPVTVGSQP